jgi:hypothetical protein
MELVSWLWWLLSYVAVGFFRLLWFLLSGWVSTLLQIALLIGVVYFLKYGWRRAPFEIWRHSKSFGRFFWAWLLCAGVRRRSEGRQDQRIWGHQHLYASFPIDAGRPDRCSKTIIA